VNKKKYSPAGYLLFSSLMSDIDVSVNDISRRKIIPEIFHSADFCVSRSLSLKRGRNLAECGPGVA